MNVLQSGDTPEIRIFVRCRTFAAPYFSRIKLLQSTNDIFAAQELLQNNLSYFCSAQEFVQHGEIFAARSINVLQQQRIRKFAASRRKEDESVEGKSVYRTCYV